MCTDPAAASTSEQRAKPLLAPGYAGRGGSRRRAGRGALFSTNIQSRRRRRQLRPPGDECLILLNLSERQAIIVGGTSGIGRAVAERLSARGESVVITGRDAERAAAVAAEIGGGVRGLALDLGRPEEIESRLDRRRTRGRARDRGDRA